jgi:hypothetical protein
MVWDPRKTGGQLSNHYKDKIEALSQGNIGKTAELSGKEIQRQTANTPVLKQVGNYFGGASTMSGKFFQNPSSIGSIAKGFQKGVMGDFGKAKKFNAGEVNAEAFAPTQSGQALQDNFATGLSSLASRQAPTVNAAMIDPTQQAQFRNQQMALAQMLEAQSMGQGPSLANQQLKMGTDRNLAQAMAMAGSMRGGNTAAGLRNVQNQTSMINQQASQQAALQRMQEQMSAREQLAGVLSSGRGLDINLASNQAGLNQQAALANQTASLQNQGQMDEMTRFYQGGIMGQQKSDRDAAMELERLRLQRELGMGQINAGLTANNNSNMTGLLAGLGSAVAYAASDQTLKTDIKSGDAKVKEFLNAISAHDYKYKDSKHGEGRFVSPMAQEIEKSELGKVGVVNTPEGKMVNYGHLAGTMLAAQGHLNKRLSDLEKALKLKHKN